MRNSNKRGNVEFSPEEYPRKTVRMTTHMDAHLFTPFQQKLRDAFSTPSTGRTLTPCTPKIPGKRDIVHRLRQQLKNRDEMIMQMQTQTLEQSRLIHMHQLRVGDLELLLKNTNKSLFVAEGEIDHLRKLLSECCTCRSRSCPTKKEVNRVYEAKVQCKDVIFLVSQARRLTDQLKLLRRDKQGRLRCLEEDYEEKIHVLESELAEARKLALENASLLEACDKERVALSCALTELQQKLESQAIKLEHIRATRNSGVVEAVRAYNDAEESENTIDTSAPAYSSTSHSSGKSQFSTDSSGVSKPDYYPRKRTVETQTRTDKDIEHVLLALQTEVDKLHSQFDIYTHLNQNEGARPSFEDVTSLQVTQLTSKLDQVIELEAINLPELSKHRENILSLKQKISVLSERFRSIKEKADGQTSSDMIQDTGNENSGEDIRQLTREMEQIMVESPRCSIDELTRLSSPDSYQGGKSTEMEITPGMYYRNNMEASPDTYYRDCVGVSRDTYNGSKNKNSMDTRRFLFDMEHDNEVLMLNHTNESYFGSNVIDFSRRSCYSSQGSSMGNCSQELGSSMVNSGWSRIENDGQAEYASQRLNGGFTLEHEHSGSRMVSETADEESVTQVGLTEDSYFESRMVNTGLTSGQEYTRSSVVNVSQPGLTLSPFSKMMAKLDLLHGSSPAASLRNSLVVAEKVERSIGSLDLAFDRVFYNTVDDTVCIHSPCKTSSGYSMID